VLSELEGIAHLAGAHSCASPALAIASSSSRGEIRKQTDNPETHLASFIARGHAKVIGHYQRLLAGDKLTSAERGDLEARLARELERSRTVLRSAA